MTEEATLFLASGLGVALFCAAFLFGDKVRPLRPLIHDPRSLASFAAGISTAYVFVHLLPELAEARESFSSAASRPLRYEGMAIYFVALGGFLWFYGLEHFRKKMRGERAEGDAGFRLNMAGWAGYVAVAAYLLEHTPERTAASTIVYAVAITFHLLAADHGFRSEHGANYTDKGRFILAGATLAGWLLGLLIALPPALTAACVAFVSGGVIVNSAIMELPTEKEGRFVAFAIGSALYALILLPLS